MHAWGSGARMVVRDGSGVTVSVVSVVLHTGSHVSGSPYRLLPDESPGLLRPERRRVFNRPLVKALIFRASRDERRPFGRSWERSKINELVEISRRYIEPFVSSITSIAFIPVSRGSYPSVAANCLDRFSRRCMVALTLHSDFRSAFGWCVDLQQLDVKFVRYLNGILFCENNHSF